MSDQPPRAFISYSWEGDGHKHWVRDLAIRLRSEGIDVTLDQWHAIPGDRLTEFMERAVRANDFVLIICTPKYRDKVDTRAGGVGYEGDIITGEILAQGNHRKFIPILRYGDGQTALPSSLRGKYYIDLRGDPYPQASYLDLLDTLHGERESPPPLGPRPRHDKRDGPTTIKAEFTHTPETRPEDLYAAASDATSAAGAARGDAAERGQRRRMVGGIAGALITLSLLIAGVLTYFRSPDAIGDASSGVGAEPITVGLLYSLTGSLSSSEKPVRNATIQAFREINEAGGVLVKGEGGTTIRRRIQWVTEDGQSNEEDFARGAEKLIESDKATTLFGCWTSSNRKRVEEVCKRHDRLLVYSVPDEGLEESSYVFYLGGTPNQLMIPAVRFVYTDLRKRRFFLVGSECISSRAAHVILRHEIESLGGTVVGDAFRPLGSTDFGPVAAEIGSSGAEIVLCTVDGNSNVVFAQALRSRGLRAPAVPTVWFNVGEIELKHMNNPKQMVGDYAPYCYFQSLDTPANKQFLERLRKDEGNPTLCVSDPMEASYSGVYLWKQAVEAAGTTDTGPLREAFKLQSFDAPEGKIRIDPPTQRAWRTPRVGRVNDKLGFDIVWAAPQPVAPDPYPSFRTRKQWDEYLAGLYKSWGGHWEEYAP